MKKSILFLLLIATVLIGKGQTTDSTITIDWCAIFNRVERSGELAINTADTALNFYCGCKYYIVINHCDTPSPIQEAFCSETNLKFVKIEEIFFCNISNYNRVTGIKYDKNKIFITVETVVDNNFQKQVLFTINTNRNKGVKTKILYPKK